MNAKKHTRFGRFRERVWRLWQQRRERLHRDPAYIFNDHASRNIAEELHVSETRVSEALLWLEENGYLK